MENSKQINFDISKNILEKFNKSDLRMTEPRMAILKVFVDGHHSHTIQEIKLHLRKLGYQLTTATIYNNISLMLDKGIILAYFNREKQESTFELNLDKGKIHTHFFDLDKKQYMFIRNSNEMIEKIEHRCNELGYDLIFGILSLVVRKKD